MSASPDPAPSLSAEAQKVVDTYWRDRARDAERELAECKEALHQLALYTDQSGEWSQHHTAGALAGHLHSWLRRILDRGVS